MIDTGNGGYVNRVKWFSELIGMWNWENSPGAEALARHYDEKFGFFNVIFDDAIPLLKELRSRGIITGVITNGPSILQHTKMDNSGLLPYCDILVVSGDIEYAKPQPQIFKYTADKLGLETGECLYVGDHPVNDIQGALSAGMKALRMNWGWFKNRDLRPDVPVIENSVRLLCMFKDISLYEKAVAKLIRRGFHISFAESCTGGLCCGALVSVADASKVLDVSFVTYANEAKMHYLGVRDETITDYGVVSEQVAREMASGVAKTAQSEVGVGITGVAGPTGGTAKNQWEWCALPFL